MKKILLFAFFLLILSACKEEVKTEIGFIGGTDGLEMSFVEGSPPEEVFGSPFKVNVLLRNVGEWDIKNSADATVTISGIYPDDFGVTSADLVQNSPSALFSRKKDPTGTIIEGSVVNLDFPTGGKTFKYRTTPAADIKSTIKADVCYSYGTKSLSSICIKKDLASKSAEICLVNSERAVSNSGAPVHISSIKESQAGTDSVLLTIEVKHVGGGRVSEIGSECSDAIGKRDRIKFRLEAMQGITCSGLENPTNPTPNSVEGILTLFAETRQITCTQPTQGQGDFEKPISITLEYDYSEFITKPITIKKIS